MVVRSCKYFYFLNEIMAFQNNSLRTHEMVVYLQHFEDRWDNMQTITDDFLPETDYGNDVRVLNNKETVNEIYKAIKGYFTIDDDMTEVMKITQKETMTEVKKIIQKETQAGNILICCSSLVEDMEDNMFGIRDCELSTQSLFYFITHKSGWHVTSIGGHPLGPLGVRLINWFGSPTLSRNKSFDYHFCIVRDPSTPELKQFNEKVFKQFNKKNPREEDVSILGPSLHSLFVWNPNEVVFLEKLIKLVSLTHDVHTLMDEIREIRLDHRGKRQAASSSDSGSSDEDIPTAGRSRDYR